MESDVATASDEFLLQGDIHNIRGDHVGTRPDQGICSYGD